MLGLGNFLNSYLKDKKALLNLLKNNLQQIETEFLIEIVKILNEELKLRIKTFEEKKNNG